MCFGRGLPPFQAGKFPLRAWILVPRVVYCVRYGGQCTSTEKDQECSTDANRCLDLRQVKSILSRVDK